MSKTCIVMVREFLTTIKRFSFWMVTLGLPIILFTVSVFSAGLSVYVMNSKQEKPDKKGEFAVLGFIDPGKLLSNDRLIDIISQERTTTQDNLQQLLDLFPISDTLRYRLVSFMETAIPFEPEDFVSKSFREFASIEDAEKALLDGDVGAILQLQNTITFPWTPTLILADEQTIKPRSLRVVEKLLRRAMLTAFIDDPERLEVMINPLEVMTVRTLGSSDPGQDRNVELRFRENLRRYILPVAFIMTMMIAVFTSTERLIRGLVEEKQNRVIEILLSSLTADQLMAGKVLGLGLAGLTQLGIWLMFLFTPISVFLAAVWFGGVSMLLFILYFLGGFVLLAIWISAFGSLGNNYQEANQWSMIWIMLAISPVFMLNVLLEQPEGTIAIFMSYFPFTSPFAVMARHAAQAIEWWEICISFTILLVFIAISIRLASKIFRIGILITGKRPTPVAVWRMLRQA